MKGSGSLWLNGVSDAPVNSDKEQDTQPLSKRRKTNEQSATDDNQGCIEEIKQKLLEKQGSSYTPMQYRCWAELIAINCHTSYDDPPPYPMFNGGRSSRTKAQSCALTTAFTSMAEAVATALKPGKASTPASCTPCSTASTGVTYSSGKIADARSKYIHQLEKLHSLFEAGALSQAEFLDQKHPILEQLNKLSP